MHVRMYTYLATGGYCSVEQFTLDASTSTLQDLVPPFLEFRHIIQFMKTAKVSSACHFEPSLGKYAVGLHICLPALQGLADR